MFRGTTPTLRFSIDSELVNFDDIKEVWISFDNPTKMTFTKKDVVFDAEKKQILLTLKQKDTLSLSGKVGVQMRILTVNDEAFATSIKTVTFEPLIKGGIIGEDRK